MNFIHKEKSEDTSKSIFKTSSSGLPQTRESVMDKSKEFVASCFLLLSLPSLANDYQAFFIVQAIVQHRREGIFGSKAYILHIKYSCTLTLAPFQYFTFRYWIPSWVEDYYCFQKDKFPIDLLWKMIPLQGQFFLQQTAKHSALASVPTSSPDTSRCLSLVRFF